MAAPDSAGSLPQCVHPVVPSTGGTAPNWLISCHQPAYRSCAARVGTSSPSDRSRPAARVEDPEVALGDLTGGIGSPAGRVRRQIRRPQLRHPATQRSDRIGQLIRSAITVAGIRGNADNNSPTRGSYPSTSEPDRTYLGGWPTPPSPCSASSPSTAQSPKSTQPATCAAVESQPSPPTRRTSHHSYGRDQSDTPRCSSMQH